MWEGEYSVHPNFSNLNASNKLRPSQFRSHWLDRQDIDTCYHPRDGLKSPFSPTNNIKKHACLTPFPQIQSAFMIDLQQIALALNLFTRRSLLIIDEFGKGTDANGEHNLLFISLSLILRTPLLNTCELTDIRYPAKQMVQASSRVLSNIFSLFPPLVAQRP